MEHAFRIEINLHVPRETLDKNGPILPRNYTQDFKQVLSQPYNKYRENLPVGIYNNAYLTNTGIGLKSFKLIDETIFNNITRQHRKHFYKYALYKYLLGRNIRINGDNLLLMHNHWTNGYHHWVTECLTKMVCLDTAQYTLVIPEDYGQFAFDSISLFNFKEIKKIPARSGLFAKEITLVANPNSGHYNPALLASLKDKLIEKCAAKAISIEPFERIYISRKTVPLRRVENEEDVIGLLTRYGFNTIDIEKLNFFQQVQLFSRCKAFVSIHGAALTNAMFMPKRGKVLELYRSLKNDSLWMNTCYWNLVTASGLDYYYQFCEHGANYGTSADNTNIIVDIPKLEQNIKLMLG